MFLIFFFSISISVVVEGSPPWLSLLYVCKPPFVLPESYFLHLFNGDNNSPPLGCGGNDMGQSPCLAGQWELLGRIFFNGLGNWDTEKDWLSQISKSAAELRIERECWIPRPSLPEIPWCFLVCILGNPRSLWDRVPASSAFTTHLSGKWADRWKAKEWKSDKMKNLQIVEQLNFSNLLHFSPSDRCVVVVHCVSFL